MIFEPPEWWVSFSSLFQSFWRNLHVERFCFQLFFGHDFVVDVLHGLLEDVLFVAAAGRAINLLI
jgi:hypothetical protein